MAAPFVPDKLPLKAIEWEPLIPFIGKANRALARYDGVLAGVPNPQVLLSPLATQEAVLSTRIEGTRATLGEVLRYDAGAENQGISNEQDIREVVNYRRALRRAEQELQARPFNLNLLLGLHNILLLNVRGQDKARGMFRKTQNWIGASDNVDEAFYVPPEAHLVPGYMDNWEKYYHSDRPDPLVQLAVIHAQFEIIHPFIDGNGRLGRMLIPLFLKEKGILSGPEFYLSGYLEKHRDVYYERLRSLSKPGNWNRWITFFMEALIAQAAENEHKARQILELYAALKERFTELIRSRYAVALLDNMFAMPYFQTSLLEFREQPARATLRSMLNRLIKANILVVVQEAAGSQGQVLAFPALIDICED